MNFLKDNKRLSFLYDNKNIWEYNIQAFVKNNGNETIFEYVLEDGFKITNIAKKYSAFDAYEWVTWFENTGKKPTKIISQLYDCDVSIPFGHAVKKKRTAYYPDPKNGTKIYAPKGSEWKADEFYCDVDALGEFGYSNHIHPGEVKEFKTTGGRSSQAFAPFFHVQHKDVSVVFAIGWTGQWNCFISREEKFINIKTKIEDTHFRLLPNEKIRTSSFVLMRNKGDFADTQNKWRRLIKTEFSLIGSSRRGQYAPLCAGIWGGMSSESVIKRIKTIKGNNLPFEYIWMDAGWYGSSEKESPDEFEGDWGSFTGDWSVNHTHHPDDLLDVRAEIEKAGMKFLLWFEPERVIYSTPIVAEHPEYFIGSPNEGENLILNLGNEQAWQYCFHVLGEKIEQLRIDCYRQDFNFNPLEYWRKNDAWDRQGITEIRHITGMYRLWDKLLERFPHLIIDNCASGGRRIDIETLRRSVPLWRSDFQCPANFPPEVSQMHNMSYATWIPYSGSGSGRDWGDKYRIRSCYAGGLTTNYTFSEKEPFGENPKQIEWIRKYMKEYLKVRPYFAADFYPLTENVSSNEAWSAAQYNRPEQQDGIVQIFKREKSPYPKAVFSLHGLSADKIYIFTDADDNSTFEMSGSYLMEQGFKIEINEKRVAKLFFYCEKQA